MLDLVDNAVRDIGGLAADSVISYTCLEGYEWDPDSGPMERTCLENGTWSGEKQPVCRGKLTESSIALSVQKCRIYYVPNCDHVSA